MAETLEAPVVEDAPKRGPGRPPKDETKAVHTQPRRPGSDRIGFQKDPTRHYIICQVGWNGGENEPYDDLVAKPSPYNPSEVMYDDSLGYVPGICKSRKQRVLHCSMRDHLYEVNESARDSSAKAGAGTEMQVPKANSAVMTVTPEPSGPRSLEMLYEGIVDPD